MVADIVFAVKPLVKLVGPFTVPPVKLEPVVPVKEIVRLPLVPLILIFWPAVSPLIGKF